MYYCLLDRQHLRLAGELCFQCSIFAFITYLLQLYIIYFEIVVFNFWQISSHLFDYSWHLWQSDVQTILHGFSTVAQAYNSNALEQDHDELYLTCERWLLCLKIIRQLIISGFPSDAKCIQVLSCSIFVFSSSFFSLNLAAYNCFNLLIFIL